VTAKVLVVDLKRFLSFEACGRWNSESPASLARPSDNRYRPASRSRFAARQKIQPTMPSATKATPIATVAITATAVASEILNRSTDP